MKINPLSDTNPSLSRIFQQAVSATQEMGFRADPFGVGRG